MACGGNALGQCGAVLRHRLKAGITPRPVLPLPAWVLMAASPLTRLPGLPRIGPDEIRRLTEDKAFDITMMRETLGISPMPLAEGLRQTFRPFSP